MRPGVAYEYAPACSRVPRNACHACRNTTSARLSWLVAPAGAFGGTTPFTAEGYAPADGEERPIGRVRAGGPRFFGTLGIPLLAGREFTDDERDPVAIVSQPLAQRMFPNAKR
jgi:hypothetical protein